MFADDFRPISTAPTDAFVHVMVRAPGGSRVEAYRDVLGFWCVAGKAMHPQPTEWQPLWPGTGYEANPINIDKHDALRKAGANRHPFKG